jgi:hypothetical protein
VRGIPVSWMRMSPNPFDGCGRKCACCIIPKARKTPTNGNGSSQRPSSGTRHGKSHTRRTSPLRSSHRDMNGDHP